MGIKALGKKIGNRIHQHVGAAYNKHAPIWGDYVKDAGEYVKDHEVEDLKSEFASNAMSWISKARENTFSVSNFKASNFDLGNFNISPTMEATGLTSVAEEIKNGANVSELVNKFKGGNTKTEAQLLAENPTPSEEEAKKIYYGNKSKGGMPSNIGQDSQSSIISNVFSTLPNINSIISASKANESKTEENKSGMLAHLKDIGFDPAMMFTPAQAPDYSSSVGKEYKTAFPQSQLFGEFQKLSSEIINILQNGASSYTFSSNDLAKDIGSNGDYKSLVVASSTGSDFKSMLNSTGSGFQNPISMFSFNDIDVEGSFKELEIVKDIGLAGLTGGASTLITIPAMVIEDKKYKEMDLKSLDDAIGYEKGSYDFNAYRGSIDSVSNESKKAFDNGMDFSNLPGMDEIKKQTTSTTYGNFDISSEINNVDLGSKLDEASNKYGSINLEDEIKKLKF